MCSIYLTCAAKRAAAVLLVQESFDYGTSTELLGQNGGTGFSSPWQSGPGDIVGGGTEAGLSGDDTSLSYPPGALSLTASGARWQGLPDTDDNDFVRLLQSPIDFGSNGVYYMSWLGQKADAADGNDFQAVGLTNELGAANRAAEIGWGSGDDVYLQAQPSPSGGFAERYLDFKTIDKTVFFVMKMVTSAGGPDEVFGHLYSATPGDEYPDTVGAEPAADGWRYSLTDVVSNEVNDRVRIFSGANPGGQIDEIRIGTTWKDVTGVPEPTTFVLLLVASGLLAMASRRVVSPMPTARP